MMISEQASGCFIIRELMRVGRVDLIGVDWFINLVKWISKGVLHHLKLPKLECLQLFSNGQNRKVLHLKRNGGM